MASPSATSRPELVHRVDIATLLEKVKALKGPDPLLDFWIGVRIEEPGSEYDALYQKDIDKHGVDEMIAPFGALTSDFNAIIALIQAQFPGWEWAAWGGKTEGEDMRPTCSAHLSDGENTYHAEDYPTAVLALCAALLLAVTAGRQS